MMKIIDLDECVVNALELFVKEGVPKIELPKFKRPLVVGSGNAAVTGQIIMEGKDAVFADEGNYKQKLKAVNVDGAVLISASGGKHAPIIAKELRRRKIRTVLLTNNKDAPANKFVGASFVFPKNVEPYTYNTSTYMGMILGHTKENPKKILDDIKKIKTPIDLKKYNAYYIIVPEEFDTVRELFETKFNELFGPKIIGRIFTTEQTKHAKTVIKSDKELFIGLGVKNKVFGKHRMNVSLSKKASYGEIMAVGYYIIGQIQKQHISYFKKNIEQYAKETSKMFGEKINVVVE